MINSTGPVPFAVILAALLACGSGSEPSPSEEPPPGFAGVRIQQTAISFQYPGEARRIAAWAVDTAGHQMRSVEVALRVRDTSKFRLGLDGQLRSRGAGDSWIVAEAFGEADSILVHFAPDRPIWRIPVLVDALDVANPGYGSIDSIPDGVERHLDWVNFQFRSATTNGYLYFDLQRLRLLESATLPERELDEPLSFRIAYDPTAVLRSGWYPDLTAHISGPFPEGMLGTWSAVTLVHELGHGRGAVDLYAQEVQQVVNNPVTGALYQAPPGIMSTMTGAWDPHSRFLINRNGAALHVLLGGNSGEFPPAIIVHVRDHTGAPVAGAAVAVYPVNWYGFRVETSPIAEGITDAAGDLHLGGEVFRFQVANFHIVATAGAETYIGWTPYVEAQGLYFMTPASPYEITLAPKPPGVTGSGQPPSPPRSIREVPPPGSRLPFPARAAPAPLP
jgi:hypothetical protein